MHLLTCLNHRLGYSRKGWTDNVIGLEYAKHFELLTCEKAHGHTHVLYVDGHASHLTRAFLEHCRNHKIKVLCYPTHTTHLYQGLDVVVFSSLKGEFGKC
jgi:prepilin-type processing-associated H-X9-DG protein